MRWALRGWPSDRRNRRGVTHDPLRLWVVSAALLSMLATGAALGAGVTAAGFPGALRSRSLPAGPYPVRVLRQLMVPMSDGIRLATDVYLPKTRGTWPAILVRTPYGKASEDRHGEFFASHGYAYVVQDVRGLFGSEGTFDPYVNDPADGLQTAQWIERQPWFNARRGLALYGGSYLAATAIDTALEHPPDLKAIYVYIASADYHEDGAWRGGAVRLQHDVGYANLLCAQVIAKVVRPDSPMLSPNPLAEPTPGRIWAEDRATPLALPSLTGICPWYRDWVNNEAHDWFWNQRGFDHRPQLAHWPHVPTEFLGAYYDLFLGGTLVDFAAASKALRRAPQAPVALTLGPWTHGASESDRAGSGYFGRQASVNPDLQALAWFDHYLEGVANGVGSQPPIHYFIMGSGSGTVTPYRGPPNPGEGDQSIDIRGTWKAAVAYPPPGTRSLPLFLGPGRTLTPVPVPARAANRTGAGRYVFRYNPLRPVPTLGGNFIFGAGVAPNGAQNQTCQPVLLDCNGAREALDRRSDTIALRTPVLRKPLTIAGHITATLYVSSSAPDTDFTARLIDDYPNGTQINVAGGIIDAKYRHGTATPSRLIPGRIYRLRLDLWESGQVFEPGHRIELMISSSNFPDYNRNMNVYGNEGLQTTREAVTAVQTVFFGGNTPSRVNLPVAPGSQGALRAIGR